MSLGDATLIASGVAAVSSIVVALITLYNRDRLHEIHVLVNGRLAKALEEIERLKDALGL